MPFFYGEQLLAPRPTPQLEDQLLLAVCDCLFNIVTQHNRDCSSMRNLRTHHAVVTGTHLSWLHSVYREKAKTGNTPISEYESLRSCSKITLGPSPVPPHSPQGRTLLSLDLYHKVNYYVKTFVSISHYYITDYKYC